jgi:Family of unknown function (DUF6314)
MSFAPQLADFAGDWMVSRAIEDRLSGLPGRFEGRARFDPADGGLHYREDGLLSLGAAAPVRATRDYLWRQQGPRPLVAFADERPFHDFDPSAPEARHHCAPDDYTVAYDFARWPVWTARWTVRGPRKDYVMRTTYRPAAPENP